MKKLPTLKQLQHLIALFDYQHFGKAAEALFVSQSTLSASILQLEQTLNAQLIERIHKNFIFTSLGKEFVAKSRIIIENSQTLVEYASHQPPMHGTLRLGCIPTIAPFIISTLASLCHKNYPQLKLSIREDTTDKLLQSLETGQLDTVVLALPYPTKGIQTQTLAKDPFEIVLSVAWIDRIKNKTIDFWPDECIFFLEKEHCITAQTLQACAIKNSNKINPLFASSLYTVIQMVKAEMGVSIVPRLAINSGILDNLNLTTLTLPANAYRELGIAWRPSSAKQENYRLLASLVKEVILTLL